MELAGSGVVIRWGRVDIAGKITKLEITLLGTLLWLLCNRSRLGEGMKPGFGAVSGSVGGIVWLLFVFPFSGHLPNSFILCLCMANAQVLVK